MYTNHAELRCQQRGISKQLCELVKKFGSYKYDGHGARVWFLPKRKLESISSLLTSSEKNLLEKKQRTYLVESIDTNSLITVGVSYRSGRRLGRLQ